MTRKTFMACLLAGLITLASTGMVEARRDDRPDRSSRQETSRRDGISLDEAVARVRRESGGRVLSAEARDRRGDTTYRIKVLLPNGAVRVYNVDARSGRSD
ncbi:MAG: PepSY domain-containing protein [Sulfuricaulis sp.]|uniref:PepSY domain-containing protein n=1 Tax=Sulfuricaulis sp. TaxID=2003553 RepID=UPI0025E3ABF6|nr:PepSY domain-containing protein [Sulfuricaulis sp.]MCR4347679.1 PepSY domain-containing protein [Sulfuricaulis sp.]